MNWNEVIYADCMNEENGLPTLEDKSIDLCLTDPPFNIQYKGKAYSSHKTQLYEDTREDYKEWCKSWFQELKRICKGILILCGNLNIWMWSDIEHPRDLVIHYKKNSQTRASASYLSKYNSILVYGKLKRLFSTNIIEQRITYESVHVHPCPDCYKLYVKILSQLKPTSIIDPFMGSGTTAEACTQLGIPWIGYELNEIYSQDINKRLKYCKKELTLTDFL